jgi:hypothetical protein
MSSDDTIIWTTFKLDHELFFEIMKSTFDMDCKLEHYSAPGVDSAFFLGSHWVDGKPYRNVNRMFGRILFGSGSFPYMTDEQLMSSRCYEILGNVADYDVLYAPFDLPPPQRIFRFYELADYSTKLELAKHGTRLEKRGIFQNVSGSDLDSV